MIDDKFGEKLKKGDTVAFLRKTKLIIGNITEVKGYTITVEDEQDSEQTYKMKSRKAVKMSGKWVKDNPKEV